MARTVEVQQVPGPNVHVIAVRGELDMDSVPIVRESVRDLHWHALPQVVLDLRGLTFIDSTGLAEVVWLQKSAAAAGKRIRILPGPPNVQRAFEVAGLSAELPWIDPRDVPAQPD